MSLLLALAAQAAVIRPTQLDSEPPAAASMCARAVKADGGPAPRMLRSAQVTYYMVSAAATGDRMQLFERMQALTIQLASAPPLSAAQSTSVLAACDKRWPLARGTARGTLPSDPFKRDTMCLAVTAVLLGAAQSFDRETGKTSEAAKYKAVNAAYEARLHDARLAKLGLTTPADYTRTGSDAIVDSLKLGNVAVLTDACAAALRSGG